jgi:hypothetical protein
MGCIVGALLNYIIMCVTVRLHELGFAAIAHII